MRSDRSRSRRATSLSNPARFVHSRADAAATFGAFRLLYWTIAAGMALGAVVEPFLLVAAAAFAVMLLLWERQIRRASDREWVLTIDDDAITVESATGDRTVRRVDASFARLRRKRIRYAAWTEVQVVGPAGKPIFAEGIRSDHRDAIVTALREHGWPVEP